METRLARLRSGDVRDARSNRAVLDFSFCCSWSRHLGCVGFVLFCLVGLSVLEEGMDPPEWHSHGDVTCVLGCVVQSDVKWYKPIWILHEPDTRVRGSDHFGNGHRVAVLL